jgi:hypothetical protein
MVPKKQTPVLNGEVQGTAPCPKCKTTLNVELIDAKTNYCWACGHGFPVAPAPGTKELSHS